MKFSATNDKGVNMIRVNLLNKPLKSITMKKAIFIIFILLLTSAINAQVTGLWEVTTVNVGDQEMTPVARWFQFNADQTMQSGNGGIEHGGGTYVITPDNSVLFFTDQYGKPDPYGAFRVTLNESKMTWNRMEDGEPVEVILVQTDKKPVGPWDKAIGNWKLVESTEHDAVNDQHIYLRWDREYRAGNGLFGEDDTRGIWQIAAHQPKLRLVSFNEDVPHQEFTISFFRDYRMVWANADESVKLVFDRDLKSN